MGNVPWTVHGHGAHSESLAMTYDNILFQSTLDLYKNVPFLLEIMSVHLTKCRCDVIGITCKKDVYFDVHIQW